MTSPSSYVFYHNNPQQERKVGTPLTRVFISGDKLTIFDKQLIRTAKSGVLFEKILKQVTFSLHRNSHGVPFLKRFDKSVTGKMTDNSLEYALRVERGRLSLGYLSTECLMLVERTILSWFNKEYAPGVFGDTRDQLLFPALADRDFPKNDSVTSAFGELQISGYKVTKLLREAYSWNSFILSLCPTVESLEDIKVINKNIERVLLFAVMKLDRPLSKFSDDELSLLLRVSKALSIPEKMIVDFMLTNSTPEDRLMIINTLFEIVEIHERIKTKEVLRFSWMSPAGFNLQRIPVNQRAALCRILKIRLDEAHEEYKTFSHEHKTADLHIETKLFPVVRDWYARAVMEPQMQTQLTPERVEHRFQELFNQPLWTEESCFKYRTKKNLVIGSIVEKFNREGKLSEFNENLSASLEALVKTKRPASKGLVLKHSSRNGYLDEDDKFVPLDGLIYSLDDILAIIERGVEITDAQLVKLGREVTPANRVAFLTLATRERKYKNTWNLYDWGVRDPKRILAFKKHKIQQKDKVQTYNNLPDEMFYELIALESGVASEHDTLKDYSFLVGRKMQYV